MAAIQYNAHLHAAITQQDYDWAEVSLMFGADCNCVDEEGNTPLHLLVLHVEDRFDDFFSLIMKFGAKLDYKNKMGLTPVELAQEHDKWDIALMMSSYFIDR